MDEWVRECVCEYVRVCMCASVRACAHACVRVSWVGTSVREFLCACMGTFLCAYVLDACMCAYARARVDCSER